MTWLESYFRGDRTIWLIVILLSIMSILAVYSSTGTLAYKYQSGNTEYYLFKHGIIMILGFVLMYIGHFVKYTFYSRIANLGIIIAIPLLFMTLLMGSNINEASRWLTLPIVNLSFQTSDFAKVALILYVARMLSKKQDNIKDFKSAFVPIIIPVGLVCGLILPANFSTAAVLFTTCVILMFIGRISLKYILLMVGIAVGIFALFLMIAYLTGYEGRIETWKARIENFSEGSDQGNYQVQQAKIAIATGGLIGKGPGNSEQRNFLPHPYSDFIFAIIVEEYGLAGGGIIVFLYLLLFYRALQIVRKTERAFAAMITIGCAFSLVFQALINMAVAVNLFPVTGQPLPMLSMGGTSIWFTSAALGIILSVSSEIDKTENEVREVAVAG
ncbi:MAG: FtsW/RodA/SpoVE family cell cycle protein [Bacteroidetes bacterium]|nr:FtsW/RodA/SpoVE family cell cycle protein [Bacteroidota bacterium]